MRCLLLGCVSPLAVVLIAAGIWYGAVALLETNPTSTPTAVARLGTVTSPTPAATRRPTGMAPTPRPAGPTKTPAPVEEQLIRLTEDELTEEMRTVLADSPDGAFFQQPQVRLREGRISVTGQIPGFFIPLRVTVTGRAEVHDGRPGFIVERVETAGLPLPDAVRDQLNRLLENDELIPVPEHIEVTRIDIEEGVMTVFGRQR